jgi:hypothetical protein
MVHEAPDPGAPLPSVADPVSAVGSADRMTTIG